ncbi:MAG TPA: hypothetical protein VIH37_07845, partial [Candidatus Limnocylindrales bacterium]
ASFGLWAMQPWAWMFAMVIAGLAVFEGFLYMIQYPGTGVGIGMMFLPGIIIIYLLSRDVKAAFGLTEPPA